MRTFYIDGTPEPSASFEGGVDLLCTSTENSECVHLILTPKEAKKLATRLAYLYYSRRGPRVGDIR